MAATKENLFRIFHADYRPVLWRFFANRHDRITAELAGDFADSGMLSRMLGLELLEYDGTQYRLDDRIERFIEDMLGAAEVAQADWLTTLIEEVRRLIEGHQKLAATAKGKTFLTASYKNSAPATAGRNGVSRKSIRRASYLPSSSCCRIIRWSPSRSSTCNG